MRRYSHNLVAKRKKKSLGGKFLLSLLKRTFERKGYQRILKLRGFSRKKSFSGSFTQLNTGGKLGKGV